MLGKIVSNEAELDLDLASTLHDMGRELPFDVVTGKTVATNDFYEGDEKYTFSIKSKQYIKLFRSFNYSIYSLHCHTTI